jgi:hypothetical protein
VKRGDSLFSQYFINNLSLETAEARAILNTHVRWNQISFLLPALAQVTLVVLDSFAAAGGLVCMIHNLKIDLNLCSINYGCEKP